ncbi:MAG: 4a-hydroxytetrahydrobiopterin dehydratase [Chitinivibrionales bacterium]|nr:4a-hydroxytetrahydrobiopterin dehydratase [Chitinivibrionales bacterium]
MAIDEKKCTPCEKGTSPLNDGEEDRLMNEIHGWDLDRKGTHRLEKAYSFDGFDEAVDFVNRVADIAREEHHHPDMCISYSKVKIDLSTHKIDGLSENDFIMASKIDKLRAEPVTAG